MSAILLRVDTQDQWICETFMIYLQIYMVYGPLQYFKICCLLLSVNISGDCDCEDKLLGLDG